MGPSVICHQQWCLEMNHGNRFKRDLTYQLHPLRSVVCRLWLDRHGVSGVEFAMILPFLLMLLIGMTEITDALNQDRKVSRMSSAITDLVAQAQTVDTDELDLYMSLGERILAPYPTDNLSIIIASVSFTATGEAEVDWSYSDPSSASSDWKPGEPPPVTLPPTVAIPSTSIVLGQATLDYVPPFAGLVLGNYKSFSSLTLSDTFYLRPRLTGTVLCSDC